MTRASTSKRAAGSTHILVTAMGLATVVILSACSSSGTVSFPDPTFASGNVAGETNAEIQEQTGEQPAPAPSVELNEPQGSEGEQSAPSRVSEKPATKENVERDAKKFNSDPVQGTVDGFNDMIADGIKTGGFTSGYTPPAGWYVRVDGQFNSLAPLPTILAIPGETVTAFVGQRVVMTPPTINGVTSTISTYAFTGVISGGLGWENLEGGIDPNSAGQLIGKAEQPGEATMTANGETARIVVVQQPAWDGR